MGRFLSSRAQKLLTYPLAGIGLMMGGYGLHSALTPDYTVDDQVIADLYDQAQQWESFTLTESMSKRVEGLAIASLGLVAIGSAIALSNAEPNRLVPENDNQTPLVLPSPQETRETLINRLKVLLSNELWLKQVIGAPLIIITGGMGGGKSSIANAIVVLRQILMANDALIFDPDADEDLAAGTWLTGQVFGTAKQGDFGDIARAYLPLALSGRTKGEPAVSVIFDEVSKWERLYNLGNEITQLVQFGAQDIRKKRVQYIFVLHADAQITADMIHSQLPPGLLTSFTTQAAIVQVPVKADDFGNPEPMGWVRFKAPNEPDVKDNYKRYAVPALLQPQGLRDESQKILEHLGIKPDVNPGQLITPEIEELIGRRLNLRDPENIDRLNRLIEGPTAPGIDASENRRASVDWRYIPHSKIAVAFFRYIFSADSPLKSGENDFDVARLSVWSKNKNIEANSFSAFLDMLNYFNLGRYTTEDKTRWTPSISPDSLPPEDA
ncbi:MAG: hypothetical protein AAF289_16550 [Cyanobacteria bacterium P01_A01_bin.135]